MAGTLIEILRKTSYDMSQLQSGQSSVILLEPYVNTMQAREVTAILRIHSAPTWGSGASVRAEAFTSDQCRDDPGLYFVAGTALASAVVAQADSITAPFIKTATGTSGLIGTCGVALKFIQASSAATFTVTLSVDLALKW